MDLKLRLDLNVYSSVLLFMGCSMLYSCDLKVIHNPALICKPEKKGVEANTDKTQRRHVKRHEGWLVFWHQHDPKQQ